MIKSLQDWAMVLSGLAVLGSLCEVILPGGSFRKYIRLGIGMLLVLGLLSPVRGILNGNWDVKESVTTERYRETKEMEEKQREEILRVYRENLNRRICSILLDCGIPSEVYCRVGEEERNFGEIEHIRVLVEDEGVEAERVYEILQRELSVAPDRIAVTS